MHIPSFFGFGAGRIIALDAQAEAVVTDVKTCWWLRVNTAPIRTAAGSRYPHIVYFTYSVDDRSYSACRFMSWLNNPPVAGQKFRLFYDPSAPEKFAFPVI